MAFNISDFAARGLPLGGARPSLFQVVVETPSGVPNVGARFSMTCRATSIPASSIGSIPVRYFGRDVKFAGSRTFQPWNVTVLNDEDFQIRQAMETWSNLINRHEANLRDPALATNSSYRTTATVNQFGKTGDIVRSYQFVNIFPVNIGAITLSWDAAEQIEEFDVEFDYDFWKIVAPSTTGTLNT
jgi:hypothetical protein